VHESCRRMMLQAPELRVQQIHCKRPGAREVEPEITCRGERERGPPPPLTRSGRRRVLERRRQHQWETDRGWVAASNAPEPDGGARVRRRLQEMAEQRRAGAPRSSGRPESDTAPARASGGRGASGLPAGEGRGVRGGGARRWLLSGAVRGRRRRRQESAPGADGGGRRPRPARMTAAGGRGLRG